MGDQNTLFCGNLAEEVTDEHLYELFLQAGPITRVNIPKTREGKSRSYAFINFKHDVSVPYAIQLMTGEKLFGRQLNVKARAGPSTFNNSADSSPQVTPGPSSRPYYRRQDEQHGREDGHRNGSDFRNHSGLPDGRRRSADSRSLHSGRQAYHGGASSTPTTPRVMPSPPVFAAVYSPNQPRYFGEHSPLAIFDPLLEDRLRAFNQAQQRSYRGQNQEHHYYQDNRRY